MLQKNINNRTIFCKDNIEVLRRIDDDTIDLIYLDPPFNKNRNFYAPIPTKEGVIEAGFRDTWYEGDIKKEELILLVHSHPKICQFINGITHIRNITDRNYLVFMAIRLIEMHRILKDTGSLYFHCDTTMSHYIKLLLDCVFGGDNFKNEVIWHYYNKMPTGGKILDKQHDTIFHYTLNKEYTLNRIEENKDKVVPIALRKKVAGKEVKIKDEQGNFIYKTYTY